jgi:ferrochelatase
MPATSSTIGVLMAQLGTPDAPTPQALRLYLKQFLSDRRVIDYHPFIWQPILRGILLNTRPRRSARLYQRIWLPEGSPLLVYSQQQARGLQARLGDGYRVVLGMRYGNPSIAAAMKRLEDEGIDRIIVLPMFPQYSSTTTASVYDAVDAAAGWRSLPESNSFIPALRFVEPYYDHPAYIEALRTHLLEQLARLDHAPDKCIITFHGIPNRYVKRGDPYRAHCERTAHLLAEAMGWEASDWLVCFQSRFGPEQWLKPYTDETLQGLARKGVQRPFVFSPGFVADCLETLHELGVEGREQFEQGGGNSQYYTLAPCLNANPAWLNTMAKLARNNALHWGENPNTALPVQAESEQILQSRI